MPFAAQPEQRAPGAAQNTALPWQLWKGVSCCSPVPHSSQWDMGGRVRGSQLGHCHCSVCWVKGLLPQVVWPELLKPWVWYSAAARALLGQRCYKNIKHQIQVRCSPTAFSLLPSGQRFSVLPPTSSLFMLHISSHKKIR